MIRQKIIISMAALAIIGVSIAEARNFRESRSIKTPHNKSQPAVKGEAKGESVKKAITVDRKLIQEAYHSIFKAWGTPELDKIISDNFSDRQDLLNAITNGVPLNAQVRFISMDSMRVLSQKSVLGEKNTVASIITAEITTEVRYQDSKLGFQSIKGTGEYIIELVTEGHDL